MRLKTNVGAVITTKPQVGEKDRKKLGVIAIMPGTDEKGFGREYPEIDPKNKAIMFQLAALVDAKIVEVEPGLEKLIPSLEEAAKAIEGVDICDENQVAPHIQEIRQKEKAIAEKRERQNAEAEKKAAEDSNQADEDAGEPAEPTDPTPEPATKEEAAPEPEKKPRGKGKKK